MDDGLVLNLTPDNTAPNATKRLAGNKGGRWTERLKAKKAAKRKERAEDFVTGQNNKLTQGQDIEVRPHKRPRTETDRSQVESRPAVSSAKHPTQIISSLFSSNPTIASPPEDATPYTTSKPSNAPVDASSFGDLGLSPLIVSHLSTKMSITQPTGIQRAALPTLLKSSESQDAFIQSQTGSGKTLSFLLPIIQDLLPLSTLSYIDRSIGTLAVIIAPTRELAQQISSVLEMLLSMRLRPSSNDHADSSQDLSIQRLTRWIVSGLLTGGSTRVHEKARLRKGIPILVSTPGRLLDHLQNTTAFDVGKCRWLVLDEADRLLDLGFEETIQGILRGLDGRRKLALQAKQEGKSAGVPEWDWKERRNILCSATLREDVQKLAGVALKNPIVIKASEASTNISPQKPSPHPGVNAGSSEKFTPPSQLTQKFVIVPLKLRLVALVALLRSLLGQTAERGRQGMKIIVFLSCTDSVDFHWSLLGGAIMDEEGKQDSSDSDSDSEADLPDKDPNNASGKSTSERVKVRSTLLPNTSIFRLHGSLPLRMRLASLREFSSKASTKASSPSILLCTSVASRGLDLPLVRAVIQHDLPTEGGVTEYVHRVGRTARVGKGGEAWVIVGPSEEQWVPWIEEHMGVGADKQATRLQQVGVETVLKSGFGGQGKEYEARATQVQSSFERWVLRHTDLARKAYMSHMRAYATHPTDEKHIFHVRNLHLGHLAKAFALREAPNMVTNKAAKPTQHKRQKGEGNHKMAGTEVTIMRKGSGRGDVQDTERRMAAVVRLQGRLNKKGGLMVPSGASDFQILDGDALSNLVHR